MRIREVHQKKGVKGTLGSIVEKSMLRGGHEFSPGKGSWVLV